MDVLRKNFVVINDIVIWGSRIGKPPYLKAQGCLFFLKWFTKYFLSNPFSHAFIALITQTEDRVLLLQIKILLKFFFSCLFPASPVSFHFISPGSFHTLWASLNPTLAFLLFESVCGGCSRSSSSLPSKPMRCISESIGLLVDFMLEDFWLMDCTGSVSCEKRRLFSEGLEYWINGPLEEVSTEKHFLFSVAKWISSWTSKILVNNSGTWANNPHTSQKSLFSECTSLTKHAQICSD